MKSRSRYQSVERGYDRAREKAETVSLLDEEYQAGNYVPTSGLLARLAEGRTTDDAEASAHLVSLMRTDE